MKDKNGVELRHGDIVRVDFVRLNAPMCTCYCKVYMDKLEVIKGKEPNTYYTREVTKIGESFNIQKENEEDFVFVNVTGIRCDNEACGWKDELVSEDEYASYVDKPCPCCGENLLTKEAYENVLQMKAFVHAANEFLKENVSNEQLNAYRRLYPDVSIRIPMNADGTFDIGNIETEEERDI